MNIILIVGIIVILFMGIVYTISLCKVSSKYGQKIDDLSKEYFEKKGSKKRW
mgnify:FL=1